MRLLKSAILLTCTIACICHTARGQDSNLWDQVASSPDARRQIITDYEASPAKLTDDMLLAVAIGYAVETNFAKAKPLYLQYLKNHPENPRALRGIGGILFKEGDYTNAVAYLKTAWSLGDSRSLQPLAVCCIRTRKYDEMNLLLPSLKARSKEQLDIANCLLGYALVKDPPDEDLVSEALVGVKGIDIATNGDTFLLIREIVGRLRLIDEDNKTIKAICAKVIDGYNSDSNAWPKTKLSLLGDAYMLNHDYDIANSIYKNVLREQPDDTSALIGVGAMLLVKSNTAEAIPLLRRAWSLGDPMALTDLAGAYLAANDLDAMNSLVPSLLEAKKDDIQLFSALVMYALAKHTPDRALFYKALDGVSDDQILRRPDTTYLVLRGLKMFGDEEHLNKLLKLKAIHDKGMRG